MPIQYNEQEQDLFLMDSSFVLAHCVSTDCAMGAGIAKEFRRRLPAMPGEVKKERPAVGEAIAYETPGGRIVVNLFTKKRYYEKPTNKTLTASLESLRRYMKREGLSKLAMPRIGSGLDRLEWEEVRLIIQDVFKDEDIEIQICIKD